MLVAVMGVNWVKGREGVVKCYHHLDGRGQGAPSKQRQRWAPALTRGVGGRLTGSGGEHQVPEHGLD